MEIFTETPNSLETWVIDFIMVERYYAAIRENDNIGISKEISLRLAVGFLLAEFAIFSLGIIRSRILFKQILPNIGIPLIMGDACLVTVISLVVAIAVMRTQRLSREQ